MTDRRPPIISLGVDPGIANSGWAFVKYQHQSYELIDFGLVKSSPAMPESTRLACINMEFSHIVAATPPTLISIENVFFGKNTTSAMSTAKVVGILQIISETYGIPSLTMTPQQVKAAATGSGVASKKSISQHIERIFNISIPNHHIVDAVAVALAGILDARAVP